MSKLEYPKDIENINSKLSEEKTLCTSHNALLPMGYFVQVVMYIVKGEKIIN